VGVRFALLRCLIARKMKRFALYCTYLDFELFNLLRYTVEELEMFIAGRS
jgi:hypothetical protein